jgi:putative aldouronate transport system substrate-binding protein
MDIRTSRRGFIGGATALAATTALGRPASASPAGRSPARRSSAQDAPKTIEVSSIRFVYSAPAPLDGPGLLAINERFGFDFKPQMVPVATYIEKLSTQIAGGDIPDIIVFQTGDSNFYEWAGQGAFADLTDHIAGYQSFEYVGENQWNLGRVNDGLFAIPQYYPPYALTPSIRQDWLDNLGLEMPTSYAELKEVAIAFTEQDASGTGAGTYGLAMSQDVNPNYAMGAYWDPLAWYHTDDQGRLVPGWTTDAGKELFHFLTELYDAGAITRDFAVMDWAATNKEFYGGKAGIFIGAPRGMSQEYFAGLKQVQPDARPVPILPFKAPDGSQHFTATSGASAITAFSAKVLEDEGKLQRLLEFIDFGRTFYPPEEATPDNPDYDWLLGGEGKGYDIVDGAIVSRDSGTEPRGLAPSTYFPDGVAWPPTPEDIDYQSHYTKEPQMGEWAGALQKMWSDYAPYEPPTNGIVSATQQEKGTELSQYFADEVTKIIAGQRPVDTWQELVDEWKNMGGEQMIDETHAAIQERDGQA